MIKILIAFALFAGVVYYYDVDVRALVEQSGAPKWLEDHGYNVKRETSTSTVSK